ncbi:MAG: radical SAM protein, partial [Armatimonadetes bacterium]|nr:radical SAM protein [Armatimonadota bacterium]
MPLGGRMAARVDAPHRTSHIDAGIKAAEDRLRSCALCEHRCGIDRTQLVGGRCGCGADSRAYFEDLLWGEEEFITPTYAIFFAGCNLRCEFCYADDQNRDPAPYPRIDPEAIAARLHACDPAPASFSFIGGEPTVHLHAALRIAAVLPADLPLVWNSNFYFTSETAALLAGVIDVFIADLHFGNDDCARALSGAERYLEVVTRNIKWACGEGRLVLRHLVVPGHVECCTAPALRWIAAEVPGANVHLMTNYLPPESRLISGLSKALSESEIEQAEALANELGIGGLRCPVSRK